MEPRQRNLKVCIIGPLWGNSPVTDEFPLQRASNSENAPMLCRHHEFASLYNQAVSYKDTFLKNILNRCLYYGGVKCCMFRAINTGLNAIEWIRTCDNGQSVHWLIT